MNLLHLVMLPAGTKFYACLPDGTVSAERMLTEDVEAEVIQRDPMVTVYDTADGLTIMVSRGEDVEDDGSVGWSPDMLVPHR